MQDPPHSTAEAAYSHNQTDSFPFLSSYSSFSGISAAASLTQFNAFRLLGYPMNGRHCEMILIRNGLSFPTILLFFAWEISWGSHPLVVLFCRLRNTHHTFTPCSVFYSSPDKQRCRFSDRIIDLSRPSAGCLSAVLSSIIEGNKKSSIFVSACSH